MQARRTYSDEYAVFDSGGRVHPFAKPIMHREANGDERSIAISDLGGSAGTCPVPVGLILDTRYDPDATWQPRRGSAGEGVFALLPHTFRMHTAPAEVLRTLARVVEGARVVHGPRGEADHIAPDLFRPDREFVVMPSGTPARYARKDWRWNHRLEAIGCSRAGRR